MEEQFHWLKLKGKGLILPFIIISALYIGFSYAYSMITSLLGSLGMTINITIIYLGTQIPILLFVFWFLYVLYFLELVERFNGLIGELIRMVVMVLYLYFALVPFATIILDVSIPSLVDINLSLNFFYIAVFLIGITVINQIFKSYVQALKYSESKNSFKQTTSSGEKNPIAASKSDSGTIFNIETPKENTVKVEKQKESPNSSAMQVILSFLFWGFGLYWIGGLFGYPYIIMPTIPLLQLNTRASYIRCKHSPRNK